MKLKTNVLLQYTLTTFLVISIFSYVIGSFIISWSMDLQIKRHLDLYPQIISQTLIDSPELAQSLIDKDSQDHQVQMQNIAGKLLNLGSIFRVKIWDTESTVVWSDDTSIIGNQFLTSELYKTAVTGTTAYEIAKPDSSEQVTESGFKEVIEIYVPIFYDDKVVGAIEIYEASDLLFSSIRKDISTTWAITGISGLTIYILLFGIFYNAYKRQTEAAQNLIKTQDVTIISLAAVAEIRDNETGDHILRTQKYVELLVTTLKKDNRFKKYLKNDEFVLNLIKSTPLHDIGKVGIPDRILRKPGKLTPEEFEIMKLHTKYGYDALSEAASMLGSNSFLETARELIYSHHEKWDGTGYPLGLKGDSIPIAGRIMALADVFDALINKRVYKDAFSFEVTKAIIIEGRGKHFDPHVVDAFLENEDEFRRIGGLINDRTQNIA